MATARSLLSTIHGSIRSSTARYRRVLALPGALGFVVPAAVARLGVAMTGLGLLLSIQHASGSYAVAGAATGVFAAAEAVVGPQLARLVDRWGQGATVPALVALHASAMILALTSAGAVPVLVTLGLVAAAGATVPQPGALSAARWVHLVSEPTTLRTAFALEATMNDAVFLGGPVLVTVASTSVTPWAGSLVAGLLLVTGCVVLACQGSTAPAPQRRRRPTTRARRTPSVAPRFVAALGVNLGLGCFFGAVPLLVTAHAAESGVPSLTGAVLALSSAASIVAGLAYGALRTDPTPQVIQLVATIVLAGAVTIGALWPSLPGATLMLVIGGCAIAPLLASSSQIVQATIPPARLTQAFTWINTASAAGIAASAALTGTLIATAGIRTATGALVGLVLVAVLSAGLAARSGPATPRGAPSPGARGGQDRRSCGPESGRGAEPRG
ncbi:MFS family permease [Clavibacter sp. B3I6]|uniref:MFS transporter n=1 Tax=Clavibacter sp. B3I6 TaxID=3042268 RepID=UPI002787C9D7|nr:MFS transporter [Clavibacter sp. B3I6]MDQ0743049.1 MFS family permease [Clavibacter sp. B3I6]